MPVPINGQAFCYHRNHKGGVYDFLRHLNAELNSAFKSLERSGV